MTSQEMDTATCFSKKKKKKEIYLKYIQNMMVF